VQSARIGCLRSKLARHELLKTAPSHRSPQVSKFVSGVFAGLLVLAARVSVGAQATTTVSPLDRVYHNLERLMDYGLVNKAILSQRPYSRREIARIVLSATQALTLLESTEIANGGVSQQGKSSKYEEIEKVLRALQEDYADEIQPLADSGVVWPTKVHVLGRVSLDVTSSRSSARAVPADNGIGTIDAWIDPLTADREGRMLFDGTTDAIETNHTLETKYLALSVTPRFTRANRADGSAITRASLQDAELRLLFHNVVLETGHQYLIVGEGLNGGLLLSNNAPPLDLVELTNDTLIALPSFLKHLGPARLALFYADLGRQQVHPGAYFAGYKLSFEPTRNFEFGVSVFTKSGGAGSTKASLSSRILDLFPFIQRSAYANLIGTGNQDEFSDRYAGLDGRWRFPEAHNVETFSELLLNDFDIRRLGSIFWEDAGHVFGVMIPRVGPSELWTLQSEFHHTGIRYYEHYQYKSGETLRQTLIGDPLGPNALGTYLQLTRDFDARRGLSFVGAWEWRSNDQYIGVGGPQGQLAFKRTEIRPKETRARLSGKYEVQSAVMGLGGLLEAGIERTLNFGFVQGTDKWGALARVALSYRFR
jgi:hypothetical protein